MNESCGKPPEHSAAVSPRPPPSPTRASERTSSSSCTWQPSLPDVLDRIPAARANTTRSIAVSAVGWCAHQALRHPGGVRPGRWQRRTARKRPTTFADPKRVLRKATSAEENCRHMATTCKGTHTHRDPALPRRGCGCSADLLWVAVVPAVRDELAEPSAAGVGVLLLARREDRVAALVAAGRVRRKVDVAVDAGRAAQVPVRLQRHVRVAEGDAAQEHELRGARRAVLVGLRRVFCKVYTCEPQSKVREPERHSQRPAIKPKTWARRSLAGSR